MKGDGENSNVYACLHDSAVMPLAGDGYMPLPCVFEECGVKYVGDERMEHFQGPMARGGARQCLAHEVTQGCGWHAKVVRGLSNIKFARRVCRRSDACRLAIRLSLEVVGGVVREEGLWQRDSKERHSLVIA